MKNFQSLFFAAVSIVLELNKFLQVLLLLLERKMSFVKFIGNFLRPSFYAGHYATISSSVNKQLLAGSPLPLFKMMVIVGTIGYTTEYIGIGRKYYFYLYYYYFLMIYYVYYYLFLFYIYNFIYVYTQ